MKPGFWNKPKAFKQHVKEEKLSCKLLMHDRDTKFTKSFDEAFSAGKRDVKVSAFRSPNTNAYVERFIQTLQLSVGALKGASYERL